MLKDNNLLSENLEMFLMSFTEDVVKGLQERLLNGVLAPNLA